jgi:hypothetical protein
MVALDGGNAMAPLARYTMAALAAANEQGRICRLRESRPARKKQQAKRQPDPHGFASPKKAACMRALH